MGFKAGEIPVLSLQPDTASSPTMMGWGWGRLGDSGWCFCAFVLLPIMATTRPLLPVVTAWQPQLHLCPPSLPNSLCLATICTNYSYQNAHLIVSLLLWAIGSAAGNLISLLFNTHSELLAVSLAPVSTSLPSSFSTHLLAHLQIFLYIDLSNVFVHWAGNTLMNDSCSNCCNFSRNRQTSGTSHTSISQMSFHQFLLVSICLIWLFYPFELFISFCFKLLQTVYRLILDTFWIFPCIIFYS